jgi:hypothetical protein
VSLGILDLPAPLLDVVDASLAWLHIPIVLRIALYAAGSAYLGMILYRRFSNQSELATVRENVARTQRALSAHDGEFSQLAPLIRENLAATLRQLALTIRPAVLASLPLLFVLPWMSNRFDYRSPVPGDIVRICARPATAAARIRSLSPDSTVDLIDGCADARWSVSAPSLVDTHGMDLFAFPPEMQSIIVHKFAWSNWIIGNPAGYLSAASPIESIDVALNDQKLVPVGPHWLRGWETPYFVVLAVVSVFIRSRWRLL